MSQIQFAPHIDVTRLPETDYTIFGRDNELKQISDALNGSKVRFISVVAIAGAGKTALINRWLRDIGSDLPPQFVALPKPTKTLLLSAEDAAKNRDLWIKEWLEVVSR